MFFFFLEIIRVASLIEMLNIFDKEMIFILITRKLTSSE